MIKTFASNSLIGFTAALPTALGMTLLQVEPEDAPSTALTKTLGKIAAVVLGAKLSLGLSKYLKCDPEGRFGGIAAGLMAPFFPEQVLKISLVASLAVGSLSCLFN